MKTKITKLDRRHTGYQHFNYMAVPNWQQNWNHVDLTDTHRLMRQWCWETFGPSCEYDEYRSLFGHRDINTRWCWLSSAENRHPRILIQSEEDKNWFLLRWS
jgi:hypothetical protein